MKLIGFVGEKGGLGKTTATIATAGALQRRGFSVAVLDCNELQLSSLRWAQRAQQTAHGAYFRVEEFTAQDFSRGRLSEFAEDVVLADLPGHRADVLRPVAGASDLLITPIAPVAFETWQLPTLLYMIDQLNAARRTARRPTVPLRALLNNISSHRARRLDDLKMEFKKLKLDPLATVIGNPPSVEEAITSGDLPLGPNYRRATKSFGELAIELETILKLKGGKNAS